MKVYKSILRRDAVDYVASLRKALEWAEWMASEEGIDAWKKTVKLHAEAAEKIYDVINMRMEMTSDPETGSPSVEIIVKTRWEGRHLTFGERRGLRKRFYQYIRERDTEETARIGCNIYVDVGCFSK
jgi:hypothetical protein